MYLPIGKPVFQPFADAVKQRVAAGQHYHPRCLPMTLYLGQTVVHRYNGFPSLSVEFWKVFNDGVEQRRGAKKGVAVVGQVDSCLLYTSDAADELT